MFIVYVFVYIVFGTWIGWKNTHSDQITEVARMNNETKEEDAKKEEKYKNEERKYSSQHRTGKKQVNVNLIIWSHENRSKIENRNHCL